MRTLLAQQPGAGVGRAGGRAGGRRGGAGGWWHTAGSGAVRVGVGGCGVAHEGSATRVMCTGGPRCVRATVAPLERRGSGVLLRRARGAWTMVAAARLAADGSPLGGWWGLLLGAGGARVGSGSARGGERRLGANRMACRVQDVRTSCRTPRSRLPLRSAGGAIAGRRAPPPDRGLESRGRADAADAMRRAHARTGVGASDAGMRTLLAQQSGAGFGRAGGRAGGGAVLADGGTRRVGSGLADAG